MSPTSNSARRTPSTTGCGCSAVDSAPVNCRDISPRRHRGPARADLRHGGEEARDRQSLSGAAAGHVQLGGPARGPRTDAVPKGPQATIKLERENNRRDRRLSPDEEVKLLEASGGVLRSLVVVCARHRDAPWRAVEPALQDVDLERNVIHIRAANAKSKKGRNVPVATTRLRTLLKWLQYRRQGRRRSRRRRCSRTKSVSRSSTFTRRGRQRSDERRSRTCRFHDLRGEFASRLVEKGVPLSQVRDLLGHSSIVTTERYDRQRFEALEVAVKRLDTGESFNFLSSGTAAGVDRRPARD